MSEKAGFIILPLPSAVGVVVVIVAILRRGRRRRIHFHQRMERSGEPFHVSEDELGQVVAVAAFKEVHLRFVEFTEF